MSWYVQSVRTQQAAVAAIRKAHGSVTYDWEWGRTNPHIIDDNARPQPPRWFATRVGVDYVGNVVGVNLVPQRAGDPSRANDETMVHVGRLGHLEVLSLSHTAVTDEGLARLEGLTNLQSLDLIEIPIGDDGLAHLQGLSQLRTLCVAGTRVTDEGVLKLERALPQLQVFREEDMVDPAALARALKDLNFARSRPVRLACLFLARRAGLMAIRGDGAELVATADAVCSLETDNPTSLIRVARACAASLRAIDDMRESALSPGERQAIRKRCQDRGLAALTHAVELGYSSIQTFEEENLRPLDEHPAYPKLLETVRRKAVSRSR